MKQFPWMLMVMLLSALMGGVIVSEALFQAANNAGQVTAMAMMASSAQP